MEYILGIDLGTTNSCAYYRSVYGDYKPLRIDDEFLLPSVISFKNNVVVVGKQAENRRIIDPKNTIYAFKRLIGRAYESTFLQTVLKYYSYNIVKHTNSVRVDVNNKLYSIESLSALILLKIKKAAIRYTNQDIKKAVITVPAFFNENQRRSVKDAGEIAGLEVLRIINEPTAAAIAYGHQTGENKKILVYDLGGGTFDVTILNIKEDIFEVMATIGDTFLGGEDFTNKIVGWIKKDILKSYNKDLNLEESPEIYHRIREVAENAKKELSIKEDTPIDIPFLFVTEEGTVNYNNILTRDILNYLINPLVDKTIELIKRLLFHLEMRTDDIDEVILVGGATRTKLVKEKMEEFFKKKIVQNLNPDKSVALGAAIYGNMLEDESNPALLLDVISQSMGIMISGGYYEKIIDKDSVIPCSAEKEFTTIRDNQEKIEIYIFQGEEGKIEENTYLGHLTINDIPPLPIGEFRINIKFIVSSEGILKLEATDLQTLKKYKLILKGTSSLSEAELQEAKENASIGKSDILYPIIYNIRSLIVPLFEKYKDDKTTLTKIEEYIMFMNDVENTKEMTLEEEAHLEATLKRILNSVKKL